MSNLPKDVLKAAAIVPTFTRDINAKNPFPALNPGCFNCVDHEVGPLDWESRFYTIEVFTAGRDWPTFGFVANRYELPSFFTEFPYRHEVTRNRLDRINPFSIELLYVYGSPSIKHDPHTLSLGETCDYVYGKGKNPQLIVDTNVNWEFFGVYCDPTLPINWEDFDPKYWTPAMISKVLHVSPSIIDEGVEPLIGTWFPHLEGLKNTSFKRIGEKPNPNRPKKARISSLTATAQEYEISSAVWVGPDDGPEY